MEALTIPGWAVFVIVLFSGAIISWAVWATISIFRNDTNIRLNEQNDINFRKTISEDITELKNDFKNLSANILNLFGQEINLLKQALTRKENQ